MKFIAAASATVLGLLTVVAVPASATDVLFEVEYADLNLQSKDGQKAFDRRIEQAARKACSYGAIKTGSRIRSSEANACVAELTAKANRQFANLTTRNTKGG